MNKKVINYQAMQKTFTALWKPTKGMCFRDLDSRGHLFQFFHDKEVACVEKGGPLTFYKHVMLKYRLILNEQPMVMPILDLSMWFQIHDLPASFRPEKILQKTCFFNMQLCWEVYGV